MAATRKIKDYLDDVVRSRRVLFWRQPSPPSFHILWFAGLIKAVRKGPSRRVLVFARAPKLGKVKTRLTGALSDEHILVLHQNLVAHSVAQVSLADHDELILWADAQPQHTFFKQLQQRYPNMQVREQRGANLGERMAAALACSKDGSQQLLIGSDCPALGPDYLNQAFDQLDTGMDVVIGPATDGGYVLIGSSNTDLDAFDSIEWGSNKVLTQTESRLRAQGLSYHLLAPLSDIDRPEDLAEARRYGLIA